MAFSLVVASGGYSLVGLCGLLIVVARALRLQQLQFPSSGAQAQLLCMGLAAPQHVGSSLTRDRTCILLHWQGGFFTTEPPGTPQNNV